MALTLAVAKDALANLPPPLQRLASLVVVIFMVSGTWYKLNDSVSQAQTDITQLRTDASARDRHLKEIDSLMGGVAVNQAREAQQLQDMQHALYRIEAAVDDDPPRRHRPPINYPQ